MVMYLRQTVYNIHKISNRIRVMYISIIGELIFLFSTEIIYKMLETTSIIVYISLIFIAVYILYVNKRYKHFLFIDQFLYGDVDV